MKRALLALAVLVAVGLAVAAFIIQRSGQSRDAELVGLWVDYPNTTPGSTRLSLEPDHTFTAVGYPIDLSCERSVYSDPSIGWMTWGKGRWAYDPQTKRLQLTYGPPADRRCKARGLPDLVVDPGMGYTDLLLYPDGLDHIATRIRLGRPRPWAPTPAARSATNQVECFRARGVWGRMCMERQDRCYTRFRDAGKACTDSSQCEGACLVDMIVVCEKGKECANPKFPEPGEPFVGICQRTDESCGSFIEIRKGRAEPGYSVD